MFTRARTRLQQLTGHPGDGATPPRVAPRRSRLRQLELEPLENRTLLSVTIAATNNGGSGYAGLDFNGSGGYTPPDTNGAAGTSAYVETSTRRWPCSPTRPRGPRPPLPR